MFVAHIIAFNGATGLHFLRFRDHRSAVGIVLVDRHRGSNSARSASLRLLRDPAGLSEAALVAFEFAF